MNAWHATVFGSENPIGKRFRRYLPGLPQQDPWAEIVGVVGHILNDNLERDPRPQVYWPETQRTQDRAALAVRTAGQPGTVSRRPSWSRSGKRIRSSPCTTFGRCSSGLAAHLQTRTLLTAMVALFGGASLFLACLGLYGVVSYTADLRLREFGIRMALGAGTGHVSGLVLRHAGKLAFWGSAIGLAFSWPVGRASKACCTGSPAAMCSRGCWRRRC